MKSTTEGLACRLCGLAAAGAMVFSASAAGGLMPEPQSAVLCAPRVERPSSAEARRPETYFFFFGGNISEKGITADLEAVKAAGIGGVKLFNGSSACGVWPGVMRHVTCLSPEWDRLIGHFGDECERLGIDFAMQVCPGWAMAGGPWIPPEKAMRHLVFSRTDVEGGRAGRVTLPNPCGNPAPWQDYRDVVVVAFPVPEGDWRAPLAPTSVSGTVNADWRAWRDGRGAVRLPGGSTTEIVFEFAEPVTVRTLELPSVRGMGPVTRSFEPGVAVSLAAEGRTLVEETPLPPSSWQDERTLSLACDEATARRFVLTVKSRRSTTLRTVRLLSAAKKDNWEAEAGWTLRSLLRRDVPRQGAAAWVKGAFVTNVTHCMAKDGAFTWDVPSGRWAVLRIGHVNTGVKNVPAPPEGTGFECDKMSSAAADLQFDNYIGRLTAPGGPAEGKLDTMLMDSWECRHQTWTPGLDRVFASRLGYCLFRWIPAVFGYVVDNPDRTARFLNDWRTLLSDMITDGFFGHMAKRAHERGLSVEFEAAFGNSIPGDVMKYYKYADTPMCEFWQPAVSFNFTPVKPIVSAAHVYGKRSVGAEAFTAFRVTWDEKLRDLKHNANMNLAEGISHFVFHTFTHNPQEPWLPPGTSFGGRGIGTTFVRGQTWWRHMPSFTDYFARCQKMLEDGTPVADVLWYLGDECDGRPDHYAPFPEGHKYDLCNPDAFLARFRVGDGGEWRTPEGTGYRVVWIPNCRRMLPETMEHLANGVAKGGVVAMAHLPGESATLKGGEDGRRRFAAARERLRTAGGGLHVGKTLDEVLRAEGIARDVMVVGAAGGSLAWNHRRAANADWYFVAPAEQGRGFDGEVEFRAAGTPEIFRPESGERAGARVVAASASTRIRLSLAPAQSCFVVFRRDGAVPAAPTSKDGARARRVELKGRWKVEFPEGWDVPVSTTVDGLTPWREMFRDSPAARAFSGTAVYTKEFDLEDADGRVVLDLGRVESIARVELNGKTFHDLWSPPYSLDVTRAAKTGKNVLRIEVTNTWYNRLVYEGWLPEAKRRTWTFRRPSPRLPLRDSGLLGPVSIHWAFDDKDGE